MDATKFKDTPEHYQAEVVKYVERVHELFPSESINQINFQMNVLMICLFNIIISADNKEYVVKGVCDNLLKMVQKLVKDEKK